MLPSFLALLFLVEFTRGSRQVLLIPHSHPRNGIQILLTQLSTSSPPMSMPVLQGCWNSCRPSANHCFGVSAVNDGQVPLEYRGSVAEWFGLPSENPGGAGSGPYGGGLFLRRQATHLLSWVVSA